MIQQFRRWHNIQILSLNFNPYRFRHFRALDFILRPYEINHRMHNKLIVADDLIAVTGGRNISSEYFEASYKFQFTDLDILFYGTAAAQAKLTFENFWTSSRSVNATHILNTSTPQDLINLRQTYQENERIDTPTEDKINDAQAELNQLLKQGYTVNWAKAHFVADSPKKISRTAKGQELIYNQIFALMGHPKQHLELVSAYFVLLKLVQTIWVN